MGWVLVVVCARRASQHGRYPQFVDGGVSLQIWRLAANLLNKLLWTADQEWSSALGVWREANNLTLYKPSFFRNITQGLETCLIKWSGRSGFIQLRIGIIGQPLWMWHWTFGFHKLWSQIDSLCQKTVWIGALFNMCFYIDNGWDRHIWKEILYQWSCVSEC